MTLDIDAIAARFKRAGQVTPPPNTAPADPPVTGHGPTVYSNTAPPTDMGTAVPTERPGRASTRRSKRRRWLPPCSPTERAAEPVDPPAAELQVCPFCHKRHQPMRLGGGGIFAPYGRPIAADSWASGRPRPLGQEADDTPLLLRRIPWRQP
jgi:hypothetical protein